MDGVEGLVVGRIRDPVLYPTTESHIQSPDAHLPPPSLGPHHRAWEREARHKALVTLGF